MKILLLGGTGVLSTPVMLSALDRGFEVYIANRGNRRKLIPPQVKLIQCDVRSTAAFSEALASYRFDVVMDFLSYTKEQILHTLSVIADKTDQYIFVSSCCAYDRRLFVDKEITDADTPTGNPLWNYGENKLECEKELYKSFSHLFFTIVRPYITFGNTRIPYGITPASTFHGTILFRIKNNKPLFVWDDGKAMTTITHTQDFARCVTALFQNNEAKQKAFNIVGDHRISWKDFIRTFEEVLERPISTVNIPSEFAAKTLPSQAGILLGDRALDARFDNHLLKAAVPSFHDTISLKDGLKQTVDYYATNNYLNGIDYSWDGMIDRLIAKWFHHSKEKNPYPLHFVDYMNSATFRNRLQYFYHRRVSSSN